MKVTKLRALLMLLLAVGVVFNGCKPEEGEEVLEPTIVFNNTSGALTANTSVEIGTNISFAVVFTKGNDGKKLKTIRLTRNLGDGSYVAVPSSNVTPTPSNLVDYAATGSIGVDADTYTITIGGITSTSAGTHTYRFYVEDKDGNKLSRDIIVTWTEPTVNPTAPRSFNVSVNSSNNVFSVRDSALAVGNLTASTSDQPNYDLYYFNSGSTGPNFVSADEIDNSLLTDFGFGSSTFTNGAATRIRLTNLSSSDFNSLNDQDLLDDRYTAGSDQTVAGWNSGTPPAPAGTRVNQTTNIAAGKVLAFSAPGGKYGLILINSADANGVSMTIKVVR